MELLNEKNLNKDKVNTAKLELAGHMELVGNSVYNEVDESKVIITFSRLYRIYLKNAIKYLKKVERRGFKLRLFINVPETYENPLKEMFK